MNNLNSLQIETLNRVKEDVLKNRDMGIKETAERNFVSPAFLVKLSKKIGYSGYKELVIAFRMSSSSIVHDGDLSINIIENYSEEKFELFKKLLDNAQTNDSYIDTEGLGYSRICSSYIADDLSERGFRTSHFVDISDVIDENVILFVVSCSGENDTVINHIERAKFAKHKVIAFGRNPSSRIARMSDVYFTVGRSYEEKQLGYNGFTGCTILAFQCMMCLYDKAKKEENKEVK